MKIKTSELQGAALDWAPAPAGESDQLPGSGSSETAGAARGAEFNQGEIT